MLNGKRMTGLHNSAIFTIFFIFFTREGRYKFIVPLTKNIQTNKHTHNKQTYTQYKQNNRVCMLHHAPLSVCQITTAEVELFQVCFSGYFSTAASVPPIRPTVTIPAPARPPRTSCLPLRPEAEPTPTAAPARFALRAVAARDVRKVAMVYILYV